MEAACSLRCLEGCTVSRAILSQKVGVSWPKVTGRHLCQTTLKEGGAMLHCYGRDCNDEASDGSSVAHR